MRKFLIYFLYVLNLAILVGSWWWFYGGSFFSGTLGSQLITVGKLMGILATYQALLQLILIGRVKWVEAVFGLDKLSRIHKWNGYAILGLIVSHVFFVTQGWGMLSNVSYPEQSMAFFRYWDEILKAAIAYAIMLVTIFLSITIVRRKLKYELWYWVHVLNYLAFILFLGHQLQYGISNQNEAFRYYWLALYIVSGGNLVWYRFVKPLIKFYYHDFTISKVIPENDGVATSIIITGKHMDRFKIKAGQFMIFRFLQAGFWTQAHPFSLSIGPNPHHIRLTAKNLGDFTATMPQLNVGTKVLIDGPHGVFTADRATTGKLLFIAGGIGITPLRSLAETLLNKDLVFLYSAKTKHEAVLLEELEVLAKQNNFKLIPIFDAEELPGYEHGRLDKATLARLVPDLASRDVFLCGPPPMMNALKDAMVELGLPKKQLHWERFAL